MSSQPDQTFSPILLNVVHCSERYQIDFYATAKNRRCVVVVVAVVVVTRIQLNHLTGVSCNQTAYGSSPPILLNDC